MGPTGLVTRTYPVRQAAPVVGYASLRYGTGGIEAAFDQALRGEAGRGSWEERWADLLHRAPRGRDVQLTIDAELQRRAQGALDGEAGAVVLLEAETGQVLAMGSAPTFDPARLTEEWEQLREDASAPLLNRATQGLYQPGIALQTVVVGEALRQGLIDGLEVDVGSTLMEGVLVDGVEVSCSVPPDGAPTLATAYTAGCAAPIRALGERFAEDGLAEAVRRWRLTSPPPLPIATEASDWSRASIVSTEDEAMGQGALTVSPLHMALVAATVANEGTMPDPQLALRVRDGAGNWRQVERARAAAWSDEAGHILSPAVSQRLFSAWRLEDIAAGEEVVAGHSGIAVAGEGSPHAWFLGAAPSAGEPRYAVAVLVERAGDPRGAAAIGRDLLQAALEVSD
jgi:peptidoglycan glycosyltransferase